MVACWTMKSLTEHLWFEIPSRRGFENITATVEDLVRKSGVREGLCLVNAMHITNECPSNQAEPKQSWETNERAYFRPRLSHVAQRFEVGKLH